MSRYPQVVASLMFPIFLVSCTTAKDRTLDPSGTAAAVALNNSALEFKKQGNFHAAEDNEEKAVLLLKTSLGEDHPDTATALGNWAGILVADGKADKALPLYMQSISIQQKTLGPDHPDLAATYASLGDVLTKDGKHEEALDFFRRAADIDVRSFGPDSISTGEILDLMANASVAKGDKPLARSYLTQIREIIAKNGTRCTPAQTPVSGDCARLKKLRDDSAKIEAQTR